MKTSNSWPLKFVLIKNLLSVTYMCAYMCKIYIPKYDHLFTLDRKDKQNSLKDMNLELWETGFH